MTVSRRLSIVVVFALLCASAAFAQLARTAVSVVNGNDANTCAPLTPCRTFARAITQTNSGGEIIVLDSGGFGPFVIDRPITVQAAPGVYAGITASTGTAIAVTPGAFASAVTIRGLTLNGAGGTTGIDVSNAFDVLIDNCVVQNFPTGISLTSNGIYAIRNTQVRGAGSGNGVVIGAAVGTPEVLIDGCHFVDNNLGLTINDHASVVMFRSVVAENGSGNITVNTANPAFLTVSDSVVHGYNKNGEAIRAQQAGATVTVTRSTIADCATAFMNVSGTFNSTGDNTINNCTSVSGGTITPLSQH